MTGSRPWESGHSTKNGRKRMQPIISDIRKFENERATERSGPWCRLSRRRSARNTECRYKQKSAHLQIPFGCWESARQGPGSEEQSRQAL